MSICSKYASLLRQTDLVEGGVTAPILHRVGIEEMNSANQNVVESRARQVQSTHEWIRNQRAKLIDEFDELTLQLELGPQRLTSGQGIQSFERALSRAHSSGRSPEPLGLGRPAASIRSPQVRIGTAGWVVPRAVAHRVGSGTTHLQRYATVLPCVEINSSFYRSHAESTYARWAASTPAGFQFAIKLPRIITHERALHWPREPLDRFLDETSGLGKKRGPILVQLPPSHAFNRRVADRFFHTFRTRYRGAIVCEPRHASWFTDAAEELLVRYQIARVAADPAVVPHATTPGGWPALSYFRWHGSPRIYWSPYRDADLQALVTAIQTRTAYGDVWCLFDNTAAGAAMGNALDLQHRWRRLRRPRG